MPLVWVTGNSGAGKSTVQKSLASRGEFAVEADWDGYSQWVNRASGRPVADPPYPVPPGWLDLFAWRISRPRIENLRATAGNRTAFLCGSAENEAEVRDLFDLVICLAIDDETLRQRLQTRTTNAFGRNPEELAAALAKNRRAGSGGQSRGAIVIDGTPPPAAVADAVLAAARALSR